MFFFAGAITVPYLCIKREGYFWLKNNKGASTLGVKKTLTQPMASVYKLVFFVLNNLAKKIY